MGQWKILLLCFSMSQLLTAQDPGLRLTAGLGSLLGNLPLSPGGPGLPCASPCLPSASPCLPCASPCLPCASPCLPSLPSCAPCLPDFLTSDCLPPLPPLPSSPPYDCDNFGDCGECFKEPSCCLPSCDFEPHSYCGGGYSDCGGGYSDCGGGYSDCGGGYSDCGGGYSDCSGGYSNCLPYAYRKPKICCLKKKCLLLKNKPLLPLCKLKLCSKLLKTKGATIGLTPGCAGIPDLSGIPCSLSSLLCGAIQKPFAGGGCYDDCC